MKTWVKDIYKFVLKVNVSMSNIGVLPNKYDESVAVLIGSWWQRPGEDSRYIHVQDYIRSLNDQT